jgi:pSer/pThr/pTyr-binding forkhead associated (FHA) protein
VFVSDLGSRNGVVVNGTVISGEHRLSDGDRIEIGAVTLRLTDPEDRYLRRLEALEEGAPAGDAQSVAADAPAPPPARSKTPPLASPAVVAEVEVATARRPAVRRSGSVTSTPRAEREKVVVRRSPLRKLTMVLAACLVVAAVAGLIVLLVG